MPPPPAQPVDIAKLVEIRLPPSPGNIMRISGLLRDFNTSTRVLTEAISIEPVLVTRIMRLANSPVYSLSKEVISISGAIEAIGTKIIHDIVLMEMTSAAFSSYILKSAVAKKIWEHSLAVAVISRALTETLNMRGAEESFTCGLLHDIGKLILLMHDRNVYERIAVEPNEAEMLRAEKNQYGYTHAEVGSLVARRWGLPEEVCYSILNHHNPSQSNRAVLVTHLLNVADAVANINGFGVRQEDPSILLFSESVIMLGFAENQIEAAWAKARENLGEVMKIYS